MKTSTPRTVGAIWEKKEETLRNFYCCCFRPVDSLKLLILKESSNFCSIYNIYSYFGQHLPVLIPPNMAWMNESSAVCLLPWGLTSQIVWLVCYLSFLGLKFLLCAHLKPFSHYACLLSVNGLLLCIFLL